jgi:hypothetical protein
VVGLHYGFTIYFMAHETHAFSPFWFPHYMLAETTYFTPDWQLLNNAGFSQLRDSLVLFSDWDLRRGGGG